MGLRFRVIQSNDRGLITKQGDRTCARRGPAKGEEGLNYRPYSAGPVAKTSISPGAGPSGQANGLGMTCLRGAFVDGRQSEHQPKE
jgi:hypothetical protein